MARKKEFDPNKALEKALDVFWCKGYEATSMQDLTQTMGLSRSSLYDTYGGKHQLFLKSLLTYRERELVKMEAFLAKSDDVVERFTALFDNTVQGVVCDQKRRGCFLMNSIVELAPHDPEVQAITVENTQRVPDIFRECVERGQANGQIALDKDASTVANYLLINLMGLRVMAKTNPDLDVLQSVANMALSVLD